MSRVKDLANKDKDYTISLRREFHRNPEPSMKEERTSKRVIEELEKIGLKPQRTAGTGVVCLIEGTSEGKTVALRADMDALELEEESDVDYKTKKDGLMHACGHDGHTASLLTAAKILNKMKDNFTGSVKLLFQPGEEIAAGASKMVDEGVVDGVDGVFGLHIWNELDTGHISIEAGPRMAAVNKFSVTVKGKGGHGSMPHQCVDPITAGSAVVMNLQSLVSRELDPNDPAVLSIGIFDSGSSMNVLPEKAYLEGTTRCFSREVNDQFPDKIGRIVEDTADAYRAEAELEYEKLTLPTINDLEMSKLGTGSAEKIVGQQGIAKIEKTTGGEDFSFFAAEAPALFAFVGARNEDKVEYHPHHHPKFNIDEDGLEIATALYVQFALDFLSEWGDNNEE